MNPENEPSSVVCAFVKSVIRWLFVRLFAQHFFKKCRVSRGFSATAELLIICYIFLSRLKTLLFSEFSLHSHLSLPQARLLEFDLSVFGSHWQWYYWWVRQIKSAQLVFGRTIMYRVSQKADCFRSLQLPYMLT